MSNDGLIPRLTLRGTYTLIDGLDLSFLFGDVAFRLCMPGCIAVVVRF